MGDGIRRQAPPPIRCGATAKHSGQPCRRWAIPGSTRCKHHGAFAGQHGRQRAQDLHAARRIEAVVTDAAARLMLASGWPAEFVQMAAGRLPTPDSGEESTASVTESDVESTVERSMARLAQNLTRQLQGAASRPETIDGQVVELEAPNGAPALAEPDEVAERIATLERRSTRKRMTEAAKLRQIRERAGADAGSVPAESNDEPEDDWVDELGEWLGVGTDAA